MVQRAFFIHALSPLHAGTGQSVDAIDLPVARYRATGIPFVPGSSIKGVLRDANRAGLPTEFRSGKADKDFAELEAPVPWADWQQVHLHRAAFGPETQEDPAAHGGAVTFGDARLLLLPLRSLRGVFAFATSPLLLRLAKRDLGDFAANIAVPTLGGEAQVARVLPGSVLVENNHVFFEDLERRANVVGNNDPLVAWGDLLASQVFADAPEYLKERLVLVDDEAMCHFWNYATQVDARVRLNEHGVVADKALWYEESLPTETLLVGLASAERPLRRAIQNEGVPYAPTAVDLLDHCLGNERAGLQFGGKASVGRGRARLIPCLGGVA